MNLQFVADGLLLGGMIGLGAIGVTLTYSILRFANFAHGEFIAAGAYAALALSGVIGAVAGREMPLGPFSFGWHVLLASVLAMILTGLLATALDALLFKRLRRHGVPITLVIASFGASMALRSLLEFGFSSQPAYFSRAIQFAVPLGLGMRITPDQMSALALTVTLVILMHLVVTRTGIGRAMRAVSENPALAEVAGIDVGRVVRATWFMGGALACAAGIMAGITTQVRPHMGFDLLLPLFSAAILGGIGSVPGAVLGGLIVGVAQSGAVYFAGAEYRAAIAFMILIGVLLIKPTGLFGGARLMLDLIGYSAFFLATALIYGVFCLGLNLQWGQTGLFNVGIAGFAAIGAYTSALLTTPETVGRLGGFDMPIAVGWAGAMAISGTIAALIGAMTLRLRADYLAIATFGVAVCIQLLALNLQSLTGGPFGIGFIPRPFASLQGNALAFNLANLAVVGIVTAAVYLALERLIRGPWGRVLRGIREDEAAAVELGKDPFSYRLQAFVIGGAILGLAGAMQGHFIGFIAPENYLSALTFQVWAMLIIGGSGNNKGAILGAIVVWFFWTLSGAVGAALAPSEFQARSAALQIVAIGVALCTVLLIRPRGLLGELPTVSRFVKP